MAESAEVLVYPRLRISELEEQMHQARERFSAQRDLTVGSMRKFIRPGNLLRNHKGALVAGSVSFLLLAKLFTVAAKVITPKIKIGGLSQILQAGWIWQAMRLSYKLYRFASED